MKPLEEIKLGPIPKYGHKMKLKDFVEYCKDGSFIDYDGFGHYATATQCSNERVSPSDITDGNYRKDFTHVIWYNR